jgi:hypothetical protein
MTCSPKKGPLRNRDSYKLLEQKRIRINEK